MCGGFPNSTTRGEPLPRMTIWEAIAILWRELRRSGSRPNGNGK